MLAAIGFALVLQAALFLFSALGAIPLRLGADPEIVLRFINMAAVVALASLGARISVAALGPGSVLPAAWLLATCPLASNLGASTLSEPIGAVFGALGLALPLR